MMSTILTGEREIAKFLIFIHLLSYLVSSNLNVKHFQLRDHYFRYTFELVISIKKQNIYYSSISLQVLLNNNSFACS